MHGIHDQNANSVSDCEQRSQGVQSYEFSTCQLVIKLMRLLENLGFLASAYGVDR